MTTPTILDLCAALSGDVNDLIACIRDGSSDSCALQECLDRANAARAALAAKPVGEGPSLRWTENMPPSEDCRYDHCTAETPFGRFLISWKGWKQFDSPTVDETPWGDWYGAFNSVDAAKAACQKEMDERLARWCRPAAPPAPEPGELGELVEWIHREAIHGPDADEWRRAATLLQQFSAPAPAVVPVAVSERLPGEGDCDEEGRSWCYTPREDFDGVLIMHSRWILSRPAEIDTHWLPAHAMPLPQAGEGES